MVDKNGELLTSPALDLTGKVCTNSEPGLLGVTEDPAFVSNNYIYLYYTAYQSGGCVNGVSRFTMSGDTADQASEKKLVDNIFSTNDNHNGGDVHFGKDGYLYISVGDGGCNSPTGTPASTKTTPRAIQTDCSARYCASPATARSPRTTHSRAQIVTAATSTVTRRP